MRSLYGVSKALAFFTLALALGLRGMWASAPRANWAEAIWALGVVLAWIATAICIIRGAPVLIEARTQLKDLDAKMTILPPEADS
jgi:hypothetical protein